MTQDIFAPALVHHVSDAHTVPHPNHQIAHQIAHIRYNTMYLRNSPKSMANCLSSSFPNGTVRTSRNCSGLVPMSTLMIFSDRMPGGLLWSRTGSRNWEMMLEREAWGWGRGVSGGEGMREELGDDATQSTDSHT